MAITDRGIDVTAPANMSVSDDNVHAPRGSRITWVDEAKGFGIILVVLGHDLRGLMNSGLMADFSAPKLIDAWIYSFHMPLFFFLAGLFVPESFEGRNKLVNFLPGKLRTIAYPYFVWSFITIALKSCLGSIPNRPRSLSDLSQIIYAPVEQYWFLYALFLLFLLFSIGRRLGIPIWAIVCLSVVSSIRLPHGGWPILNVALSEAIYFSLGALLAPRLFDHPQLLRSPAVLLSGLAASLIPLAIDFKPLAALAGICFAISVAQLASHRAGWLLGLLGQFSLEIYLVHSIVSAATRVLLLHIGISAPLVQLSAGCATGILIPLLLGIIARKHFPYLFVLDLSRNRAFAAR